MRIFLDFTQPIDAIFIPLCFFLNTRELALDEGEHLEIICYDDPFYPLQIESEEDRTILRVTSPLGETSLEIWHPSPPRANLLPQPSWGAYIEFYCGGSLRVTLL